MHARRGRFFEHACSALLGSSPTLLTPSGPARSEGAQLSTAARAPSNQWGSPHSEWGTPGGAFRAGHSASSIPSGVFRFPCGAFRIPSGAFRVGHSERIPILGVMAAQLPPCRDSSMPLPAAQMPLCCPIPLLPRPALPAVGGLRMPPMQGMRTLCGPPCGR
jgi:hypothetical protein